MGASRREILLSTTALAGVALVARGRGAWAQEPVKGGTLIVAADTEPRNLNPAMVASNGVFYVSSKVVEPLVEMDYETGLRPVLATEWGGSEDGLTYTVKLREGVTFSDGTPFTSEDVAFSAMQVWKPLQNLGRVVFPNLEAVDTPDPLTAVFTFSVPTPPQLIENALPALSSVLPKHLYDGSDIAENPLNMAPVGTGPFVFAEHRPGEFIRLERNPTYWGEGQPYLDAILYRVLPDAGAKAAALETGDIHLTAFSAVPLAEMPRLDALDDVTVVDKGYEGITYQITLEINHRRAELANPLVRQALRHAIDPQFIVDVVFMGYATAATGPVPSSAADFYTADVATYDFDIAAAEALLDEAGYPRGADGTRFSLRLRPAPWFEQTRAVGDYVRQALQKVGIAVELVTADPGGHIAAVYTDHDFDLAIGSPVYRNDPAISTTILFQGGLPAGVPFSNQFGYDDPEMNEIIAKGLRTIDSAERVAVYEEFQRKAAEDLPILVLVDFTFLTVARDEVRNVANNPRWATSSWADTWLQP
ncbi:MAG: ABC transporter substrate-binding protein [Geminicoccaceae bacterium]|nr:ABC transporter substrate-binding protein [Geminicoccaceae bacterium]